MEMRRQGFVGAALSSTMIVVKILYDKAELDTGPGRITLAILVFLFLMVRRTRSDIMGGGFLSGFSKSPAKRYEGADQIITFKDVAGVFPHAALRMDPPPGFGWASGRSGSLMIPDADRRQFLRATGTACTFRTPRR